MFVTLDDAAAGRTARRTQQPVRRHSRPEGHSEGLFWRKISRHEGRQIVQGARKYDLAIRRETGRRALGPVALEVLEYMASLAVLGGGKVYPTYARLMGKLGRSRDAIARALKALRAHGFLDWLRRYVTTGDKGRGPQVQQTSNAYRLSLPARAARLLGLAPPLPDDFAAALAEQSDRTKAMLDAVSPEERMAFLFGAGDPLGQAMARLERLVKERESAKQTESPLKDF